MSWNARALNALLKRDVDDVVVRGRSLDGKDRTAALRDSLSRLESSSVPLERLKTLLLIQTLLASIPDGKLTPSLAEPAAIELARVVISASDSDELKRSALDGLALLFLKARELTTSADARVRAAFTASRNSPDPQISDFAQRAFLANGVLSQRVVQRQYRYITLSIKAAAAISAIGGVGYAVLKVARKKQAATKRKRTTSSSPRSHA